MTVVDAKHILARLDDEARPGKLLLIVMILYIYIYNVYYITYYML